MPKIPASKFFPLYAHGDGTRRSYPESLPGLTINSAVRDAIERISAAAGGGAITPSLVVEYSDLAGNRQTTPVAADGSTTITGVAPFLVHFDGRGTRSAVATTLAQAWSRPGEAEIGYRMAYGEGLGGAWPYGNGQSRDEDRGAPIWGRAFTALGSRAVTMHCLDTSANAGSISLTVNVTAPPSATNILSAAQGGTGWPTFTSNTRWTLNRGQDYRSFGELVTSNLHNVIIEATGAGAQPRVQRMVFDSRANSSGTSRSSHIRAIGLDIDQGGCGGVGFDYCGYIDCNVRTIGFSPIYFNYDNSSALTNAQRDSLRYPRGFFVWNCTGIGTGGSQYALIFTGRRMHFVGSEIIQDSGLGGGGNIRIGGESCSIRYCNPYHAVSGSNVNLRLQVPGNDVTNANNDWPDNDDRAGQTTFIGQPGRFSYKNAFWAIDNNQLSRAGAVIPNGLVSCSPQNNDAPEPDEGHEFICFENLRAFESGTVSIIDGDNMNVGGREISLRNARKNNGAGAYLTRTPSANSNRIPAGMDGPYPYETVNTRPVP